MLRWVEPVAWNSIGDLFTLWSEGAVLWLGRSADAGVTWNRWPIAEDSTMLYFPYMIARADFTFRPYRIERGSTVPSDGG